MNTIHEGKPLTKPTALDDVPRIEFTARHAGELFRLLDGICSGPAGRLLRRAVGSDGRALFEQADVRGKIVWVAPSLVELIRGLRAAMPAKVCGRCNGEMCAWCGYVGYTPARPNELVTAPAPVGFPTAGEVEDVWGWLKKLEEGGG